MPIRVVVAEDQGMVLGALVALLEIGRQSFRALQVLGADLHDAASAVRHQQEVFAVLLVDDHVERLVAVAEFGDGRSLGLLARLEAADGELHEWRAGEAGEQARFAIDVQRDEGTDRGVVFGATVGGVIDLDIAADVSVIKRERDFTHVRGRRSTCNA